MTHGPPLGRGDGSVLGTRAGCLDLLNEVQNRVKPQFHCFGHIHEGYGASTDGTTTFVNAATLRRGTETNAPFVFDVEARTARI